jgi:hypothetical protein
LSYVFLVFHVRFLKIIFCLVCAMPCVAFALEAPPRSVLYGSFDQGRYAFVTAGYKRTLFDHLNANGVFMEGSVGAGHAGAPPALSRRIQLTTLSNSLDPTFKGHLSTGYQWMTGNGTISVLAGVEGRHGRQGIAQKEQLDAGLRVQGNVWIHPTPTTLFTSTAIVSTLGSSVWARAAWGFKMFDRVYVGPETSYSYEKFSLKGDAKGRIGMHATGFEWGTLRITLSGGYQREIDAKRHAGYVSLGAYRLFEE